MNDKSLVLTLFPFWSIDRPPSGLLYISSYLQHFGYDVTIKDFNILCYQKTEDETLYSTEIPDQQQIDAFIDEHVSVVQEMVNELSYFDVIGISLYRNTTTFSLSVIQKLKEQYPDNIIIVGGPEATFFERLSSEQGFSDIDFVVFGDGEQTMLELMKELDNTSLDEIDLPNVFNNITKKKPNVEHNYSRNTGYSVISKKILSHFPYRSNVIPFYFGRGCLNRCSFCNNNLYNTNYVPKEPKIVIQELQYYIENGYNHFVLEDEMFNSNLKYLREICETIIKKKWTIHWSGQAAIREKMTESDFRLLSQAGCTQITFGLESASDNVLTSMKKGFSQSVAKRILSLSHNSGINTGINLIVGFPGETEEQFQETITFISQNHSNIDYVENLNVLLITPQSDLEINPKKYSICLNEEGYIFPSHESHWKYWKDSVGNTYDRRLQKIKEIKRILNCHYIPIYNYRDFCE